MTPAEHGAAWARLAPPLTDNQVQAAARILAAVQDGYVPPVEGPRDLNAAQQAALQWVADGMPGDATNSLKLSTRALVNRRLATVKGRGPSWSASLTDDGRHFLEHGRYPPARYPKKSTPAAAPAAVQPPEVKPKASPKRPAPPPPPPVWEVNSPRGARESGRRPRGDALFSPESPDPFDERVLISVKEAAWMLSMSESMVRDAVTTGDVDRVFLSNHKYGYRIVYGSLLAWVNDLPRESSRDPWWR